MRYFLILLFLTTATCSAQQGFGPPNTGPDMQQGQDLFLDYGSDDDAGDEEEFPFSHEGLSRKANSVFTSSGMASTIGVGAFARMNYMQSEVSAMQFSTGYIALREGAQSNLAGNGIFASVVPVFVGLRHNLVTMETSSMEWTQYAVAGAGPVIGVEYPQSHSFWQSISKMGLRWGAGAYAGFGSEMRFSQGLGLYAQLEYTGYGFTAPLLDRQTYLGPSFSFGIMFFPS